MLMRWNKVGRLAGVALIAFLAAPLTASAQDSAAGYPNKTIRFVVGFAAGGGNDIFARIIGQKLSERTGQPVVIDNRPGAAGRLSAEYVATQPADGYTILVGASGAMAIGPLIYKTGYQTLKTFVPVTMIADFPLFLVVSPEHPAKTVQQLVAWTKANPGEANYATSSPAFTLPTELFKLRTGAQGVAIPYRSSNESVLSIMQGNAAMTIVDPPPSTQQVQAGKLRALAVTAKSRSRELPDVPTMAEAGVPDVNLGLWSGFFVPAGTPPPIVDKLAKEFREIVLNTDAKDRLVAMATTPSGIGPAEFARHIDAEIKLWDGVIKAGNLKFAE
jgi:tripartite-type tricarboxylate transporter receptor subunit TctC